MADEILNKSEQSQKIRGDLDLKMVCEMLLRIFSAIPTFICIDAIDELDHCTLKDLLHCITEAMPPTGRYKPRLFLTARPHVKMEVEKSLDLKPSSPIMIEAKEGDIEKYLRHQMDYEDLDSDAMNEEFKKLIISRIVKMSEGMYVSSYLARDRIKSLFLNGLGFYSRLYT